ncbi:MAG: helix-turn-helix transcriptional regulator [Gordonibacter sp.]
MAIQLVFGFGYPLSMLGLIPQEFLAFDLLISALIIPFVELAWSEAYALLHKRDIVKWTAGSLAAAVVLLLLLQWLPPMASIIVMKVLPLGSVALIVILKRTPFVPAYELPNRKLNSMIPSWRFLAGALFAMAASAVLPGSAETGGFISWGSIIAGNALAAVLVFFLVASKRKGDYQKALMVFIGIMTICYAASGLFIRGDASSTMNVLKIAQHCIILATQQCVYVALWFALLDMAQKSRMSPFLVCGFGLGAVEAGRATGASIGMIVPLDPAALSILALLLLVPSMYFFATNTPPKEVCIDAETILKRKIERITSVSRLTSRESEILELWVTGHRLDYVAESLFISKNTVKTHLRHIYQKTQTRNKEDLLVLFDQQ